MSEFERVARLHAQQPFFHFLYVGNQPARWEALRAAMEEMGCFETIKSITVEELRQDETAGVERKEFGVSRFAGCLIEVWDIIDACSGSDLVAVLTGSPFRVLFSPQSVRFGLLPEGQGLRFRDFIAAIDHNFAGVGDLAGCVEAVGSWCGGGESVNGPLSLRMACNKEPSYWLRSIKHDYGNLLDQLPAELRKEQIRIDFWQDKVRNVLSFPFQNSPARRINQVQGDRESSVELIRQIFSAKKEIVVPRWMEMSLSSEGWMEGTEFSIYGNREEAVACLEAGAARGHATIVVRDSTMLREGIALQAGAVAKVPSVLVGDPELRLPWQEWTRALSENVLGSFSRADFMNASSESYVPVIKADYWKAFCFVTLPESVDHILDLMLVTYAGVEALGESTANDKIRVSLFGCIAQVWCARALYFGGFSAALSLPGSSGRD